MNGLGPIACVLRVMFVDRVSVLNCRDLERSIVLYADSRSTTNWLALTWTIYSVNFSYIFYL
jgi:hypothetical protein